MAKYGEGDKRWIVEERTDGTNVHNWHWAETNCLEWSRTFLTILLSNKPILNGPSNLFLNTTSVDQVSGEAYVNIRKGKIIPGYELSVSISFIGEAKDPDGKTLLITDGKVEIPYISDENAGEDPEVKVSVKDEGPIGKSLKEAFLVNGKPFVLDQVRAYVNAMAKGGPAKDDLEVKKQQPSSLAAKKAMPVGPTKVVDKKDERKEEKKKEGFKSIEMTERFSCRARDLYEIIMDENRWKGFSQSNARISKEVGGKFSIFDGSITGRNEELEEGKLIVQKWRFGSWPDGIQSTVRLTFEEPQSGITIVKLTHNDVPEEDRYGNATVVENTERGWRDLIFNKIRVVFGFGI